MSQTFFCEKDIAREIGVSPWTVKRWWKKFRIKPTIPRHACNRWNRRAVNRLIAAIRQIRKPR